MPKLLLLGDSITEFSTRVEGSNVGWSIMLNNYYFNKMDVIIRAKSSHTTVSLITYVEDIMVDVMPDVVILTIGSNDASRSDWIQYVSLDDYIDNITRMIDVFIKHKIKKVLLVTPPPLDVDHWNEYSNKHYHLDPNIKNLEITRKYAQAVATIASNYPDYAYCVDLWADPIKWLDDCCYSDGLHLSEHGNKLFYEEIVTAIQQYIPEYSINNLTPFIQEYSFDHR